MVGYNVKKKQQQNTIHQGLYPAIYVPKKGEKKKTLLSRI